MKKVFFNTLMVAGISGMMVGCADDIENLYDPDYMTAKQEYESQWKKQFGTIDPQQDWGFGSDASSEAKAMTRGTDPNSNMWSTYVDVPGAITSDEAEAVKEVFSKPVNPELVRQLNFSDFFVQHVYGAKHSYQTEQKDDGTVETLENVKLEEMATAFKNADGTYTYDHVNNFNASDGSIMLMVASSTECFAYKNTNDNGAYYTDYVIMEVNGEYYVGFDYSCNVTNKVVKADGIYDDWIVKIVPAEYTNAKRIICEDLGNIGDFDFNDIVFDAYITWSWNGTENVPEAVISVKAAGGTLPIYINGVEVHEAMGVPTNVMVNTGAANGVSAPAAIFRVPASSENIIDIEVKVNGTLVLEAPQGDAPQKICVPTTFKWCTERTNIKDAYAGFTAWTQDVTSNTDWYNSPIEGTVME